MRPAECLEGLRLEGGWSVKEPIHKPPTATGGKFSVGYVVLRDDGLSGYLKALDLSGAWQQPDFTRALGAMLDAYNFEKELLQRCQNRRMRRVVTPLADGQVDVPGNFGDLSRVPYLIFELADGDIRGMVARSQRLDIAWALRSLHHTAIGLRQLHAAGIAHQDLKPSNVLVFRSEGSKVADLGRASFVEIPSTADELAIPGDLGYTPPEQFYGWRSSAEFTTRYLADLYLLGSLVFFYFLRCSATQLTQLKLSQKQRPVTRSPSFLEDLPYIQHAFAEAILELRRALVDAVDDLADEIVMITEQLCEPDPRRRGDPKVRASINLQHDLQPYISRFDRLARRAEVRLI